MQIAVLGTGTVGQTLAGRLAGLGHEVTVGTRDVAATRASASDEALADWIAAHPDVPFAAFADAASSAQVIVNAVSGQAALAALGAAGAESLSGKVLIDVSNPLDFSGGFPPTLFVKDTDSLGEQVQAAFPDARVVKALNTMTAALMVDPGSLADGDHTTFICGDDESAKRTVTDLLEQMGHRDVLDLGGISASRGMEMYLGLWTRMMPVLGTAMFNVKVVR